MPIRVRIPTPLRPHTGGRAEVAVAGATVAAAIDALLAQAPALRAQLLTEDGRPRSFVNLYLNGEDVRSRSGLDTALHDGDELAIVPAIAGGLRLARGRAVRNEPPFTGDRPSIHQEGA